MLLNVYRKLPQNREQKIAQMLSGDILYYDLVNEPHFLIGVDMGL